MAVDTSPKSNTWTYVDGEWLPGNPPLIGPTSHAMWLASTVFDGARWFDGLAPDLDLHCQRVNRSATNMGMIPTKTPEEIEALALEGVKKFDGKTAIYIKPMYWAEHGSVGSVVAPDGASTRFALCLFEAPMDAGKSLTLTVSPLRRPSPETAMTDAKAGSLYPNSGRAIIEARSRGFDNALMRDMNGNVAETAASNTFSWSRMALSLPRFQTAPSLLASLARALWACFVRRVSRSAKRRFRLKTSRTPMRFSAPATIPRFLRSPSWTRRNCRLVRSPARHWSFISNGPSQALTPNYTSTKRPGFPAVFLSCHTYSG